ncbi:MAG: CBS domain-containing protein [Gammaproteobacteria bacterium]|nr:CBS domain-containing protein [Gammaproteobacteria bacterium]
MTSRFSYRHWLDRARRLLRAAPQDRTELLEVLRQSQRQHLLDGDALTMMEGVLQVSEMRVRDIMIPRAQMVVIERDADLDEILPVVVESAHSRFPVIGDNRDEVIGILLAKDLLRFFTNDKRDEFSVRDLLRPAVFIPESKRLNVLLREFRSSRNHIAIVINEYGGVDGLVTIEDVLEQIVGEIVDEHDVDEGGFILKHSEVKYTIKGLTSIEVFNEYFATQFSDDEYDTIGGMVIREFGHLPRRGELLVMESNPAMPRDMRFRIKVLHADSRRVHLLQFIIETVVPVAAD